MVKIGLNNFKVGGVGFWGVRGGGPCGRGGGAGTEFGVVVGCILFGMHFHTQKMHF